MNFKLSRIALVAGLAVLASSAFADPTSPFRAPSNYSSGTYDVYLAGSSAVDLALTKFIANTCATNTLDTYRSDAGGKTYYLWTCETAPGSNFKLTSGATKIAIHKNTNSSSDGVTLVSNAGGSLAFLQVSDLAGASACPVAPQAVAATSTIPAYNVFNCSGTVGTAGVPQGTHPVTFGFSDSEPSQFNPAVASEITAVSPLTIVFGVPVTKNVRDALQTSQGLTAGDESEAGMPTLSSAAVAALFTGKYTSWANLGISIAGSDQKVYLVRRSAGSGTTRSFDATFVGDICVPGNAGLVTATTLSTATLAAQCTATGAKGGTQKLQAGTSDDMAACLSSFQQNGAVGAVGYLSTDYLPGTSDGYRWIKVDGYAPKLLNVVDGKWKNWSEESLNYNTALGIAGDDAAFYGTIQTTSASATLLSEIAKNLPQTTSGGWTGGVMGTLPSRANGNNAWGLAAGASLAVPRTDATVLNYPANPMTRATSTGFRLCSVPAPAAGYTAQ